MMMLRGSVRRMTIQAAAYPRFNALTKVSASTAGDEVHFVTEDALKRKMEGSSSFNAEDVKKEKVFREYKDGKRIFHFVVDDSKKNTNGGKDLVAEYRKAACSAVQRLTSLKSTAASFFVECEDDAKSDVGKTVLQSLMLAGYSFDKYITVEDKKPSFLQDVSLHVNGSSFQDAETIAASKGTVLARDLMNERADVANPKGIHDVAERVAADFNLNCHSIVGIPALDHERMHLMSAVGQGSRFEPRLVCLEHMRGPTDAPPVVLVGKGITFDTGGLNLKPTNFIETMHYDMGGTAAVLGTMRAIADLNLPINVVGVLALAENAIGSGAYKPMAVIQSRSGKTVEVGNTDAEGRLVLADALTYAQDRYKPTTVVDVATLTGACVVALGPYGAGLFTNNDDLQSSLVTAGSSVFERVWPLPIFPEHREELKGAFADINSTGTSRYGGASTAAAFLESFIQDSVHWAHVDIAGPSDYSKASGPFNAGGTGFGTQLLTRYLAATAAA
ncbi:hypothetical protein PTSG_03633 [Salpingoeca rosetta]|uniref:leucyl aminopeptidase n=1 Tax=Salpingoeca rosetta (strain ATCC 50818 / BSB-021) TaxID=946362 RepID=F2U656_SALR5|nr:uncharacterized protein PTSG_03633 [Salpingoeca rosetta]EGD82997.1 hypothetical protein PTSG_03633 [Salpingoeca rosetta]|eukprot:XP_004995361.1 hypothetical protein PTSG_03633 [Salpingoeca rosetta]